MTAPTPPPEFSRPLTVGHIPANGVDQTLEARPAERTALAARFELIAIDSLTAQLTAIPGRLGSVTVTGKATAAVTQRCVVTLDPLPTVFDIMIDTVFLPASERQDGAGPAEGTDSEEDVEFFEHGRIDLGELVAQQMAISLDPYPRKPGAAITAALAAPSTGMTEDGPKRKALAGLADLRLISAPGSQKPTKKPQKPRPKG